MRYYCFTCKARRVPRAADECAAQDHHVVSEEKKHEMDRCEHCGLIEGHANKCFVDVLYSRFRAMKRIMEEAQVLVDLVPGPAKVQAEVKLRAALDHFMVVDERESRMVGT